MAAGESVHGTISVRPNSKNHRDVDISLTVQFAGQHGASSQTLEYKLR